MWDFKHQNLPECFDSYFINVNEIHNYFTRSAANYKLSECAFNTLHGKRQFGYFGVKIHNSINELDFLMLINLSLFLKTNTKNIY